MTQPVLVALRTSEVDSRHVLGAHELGPVTMKEVMPSSSLAKRLRSTDPMFDM
jgi:hypothetical protein